MVSVENPIANCPSIAVMIIQPSAAAHVRIWAMNVQPSGNVSVRSRNSARREIVGDQRVEPPMEQRDHRRGERLTARHLLAGEVEQHAAVPGIRSRRCCTQYRHWAAAPFSGGGSVGRNTPSSYAE